VAKRVFNGWKELEEIIFFFLKRVTKPTVIMPFEEGNTPHCFYEVISIVSKNNQLIFTKKEMYNSVLLLSGTSERRACSENVCITSSIAPSFSHLSSTI
jgi:hypothetical protein